MQVSPALQVKHMSKRQGFLLASGAMMGYSSEVPHLRALGTRPRRTDARTQNLG